MKFIQTGELLPGIFAVFNGQVNFYLMKCGEKYVAFDAGASIKMTQPELQKLAINPDDVAAVFCTHTDSDHIGGIDLFQHAKVYISGPEEQMIDGSAKRAPLLGYNKLDRPYIKLEDGEVCAEYGTDIKCVVTPGHTKGSSCFLAGSRYLFAGDNFSLKNGKIRPFIRLLNMDNTEHKKSIAKITQLNNIEAAFTSHHGYTTSFAEAAV